VPLDFVKSVLGPIPKLEVELEEHGRTCDATGHKWIDPKTRIMCKHCGSVWFPQQN
jgi:hypothetical protein